MSLSDFLGGPKVSPQPADSQGPRAVHDASLHEKLDSLLELLKNKFLDQKKQEIVTLGNVQWFYESYGYRNVAIFADASAAGVNLTLSYGTTSYTYTLQAGPNNMSIPDGTVVTASGTVSVMVVRDNFPVYRSEVVTITGQPNVTPLIGGSAGFTSGNPGYVEASLTGSNAINAALKMLTTSNAATPLPAVSCREITLIGLKKNVGTVYVGGSDVLHVDAPSAAPSLATATSGGSLPAATYYMKFTWVTPNGETVASPEASITTTGTTSTITATIPSLPAGVTSANAYLSTSTGTETKQGSTTSTSYTQSAALVAGAALPVADTASKYGAALDPKDDMTFVVNNADLLYIFGAAGDGVSYVAV